ncbi:MAG: glycine cleavage system protein GcvH [Myxococcales bacterium]|nr:glycine cleavage system protein GcvH [Myxococcales bacterium]
MSVPSDLLYTEEHEWVRKEDDDVVLIGITAFAQEQLGTVVYVELPEEGSEVAKGESIGQIESTKSASDIYAPVSGQVVEVNSALEDAPELLNSNPYEDGWIMRVKLESPDELEELLRSSEYKEQIADS